MALFVEWNKAGVFHSEPVGAFLKVGTSAAPTEDWVYIGSYFMQNGRYAAAELKNLIGFSHDRESIIQHRSGLGLEQYGLVQISDRPYDPTAQYTLRVRALAK